MRLRSFIARHTGFIRRIRGSRRGSSAVFLCVILSALITICFAFIYSTLEYTTASRVDALMHLSGDSLLSEFDRDVLDEYGLFLLRDSNKVLSSKLRGYLNYTFGRERSVRVSDVSASDSPYALTIPEAEDQILKYMKADGLRLYSLKQSGPAISTHARGRTLRHGPTIASLPSRHMASEPDLSESGIKEKFSGIAETIKSSGAAEEHFRALAGHAMLQFYVLGKFNSQTNTVNKEHFFHHEVEYVLFGRLSDKGNGRLAYWALFGLKGPFNLVQCYLDPKRKKAIDLVSDPFPAFARYIVKAGLIAAWSSAESINDVELLMQGHKVPLWKKKENWAISLKNILDKLEESGVDTSGEKYTAESESEAAGTPGESAGGNKAGKTAGNAQEAGAEGTAETSAETSAEDEEARRKRIESDVKKDFDPSNFKKFKLDYVIHPEKDEGLTYNQYLLMLLVVENKDLMIARVLDLIQINMRKNVDGHFLISECCTGVKYHASVNGRKYSYEKHY